MKKRLFLFIFLAFVLAPCFALATWPISPVGEPYSLNTGFSVDNNVISPTTAKTDLLATYPSTAAAAIYIYVDGNFFYENSGCHHSCSAWDNFNQISGCTYCGGEESGRIVADFASDYGKNLSTWSPETALLSGICTSSIPDGSEIIYFYCANGTPNKCYYIELTKTDWTGSVCQLTPVDYGPQFSFVTASSTQFDSPDDTIEFTYSNFGDIAYLRFDWIYQETADHSQSYDIPVSGSGNVEISIWDIGHFWKDGFWYPMVTAIDSDYQFVQLFDLATEFDYSVDYRASYAADSLYCSTLTETECESVGNASRCFWDTTICSTKTEPPVLDDYPFSDTDFGYLGNMFRDVLTNLFFPSPSYFQNQMNAIKASLNSKLPFAYFNVIRSKWVGIASEISEEDYPVIAIDDPFSEDPEVVINLLDFSEAKNLVGETIFALFYSICQYGIWLGVVLLIWETLNKNNSSKL